MVATEITAASFPQPRKKNRNVNDTTRLNHMAGRGMPKRACTRPKIFGMVPLRSIADLSVVLGPQDDYFEHEAFALFLEASFALSPVAARPAPIAVVTSPTRR